MNIREMIKKSRIYFDGGMGTMLQAAGLGPGENSAEWNLSHPDEVTAVHRAYLEAGSNVICANTFGINPLHHENYEQLICVAISCAKEATKEFSGSFVAYDMGPCGKMLEPLGDLSFDCAVDCFCKMAKVAKQAGADLIFIETMNDCYETKAAVVGAKEGCDLPIFVSNVYDNTKKLMTGANPTAMAAMLEGLGVDAYGMNCSLGPRQMIPVIEELTAVSSLPVIVVPNAGLPRVEQGKTVYDVSPRDFAEVMAEIAKMGSVLLGGCCGTTPEHIRLTVEATKTIPYSYPEKKETTLVSSYTHSVEIGKDPVLIGERINPTGKPKLKEALKLGNLNYILNEGIRQSEQGVHILDVNVGLPEINEAEMMRKCVTQLQAVSDLPLQIDTGDPVALEQGARFYNGKPLINSVNGKKSSMETVFPVVKKYGGAVIALTMDESGIPDTAQGRFEIAKKIVDCAKEWGIDRKDIIVDPLALTISSNPDGARVTLESVKLIREELGVATSLGVSNISFGLPERETINTAFFVMALEQGLSCAIMNPFSEGMMGAYYAFRALREMDPGCGAYIASRTKEEEKTDLANDLSGSVLKGLSKQAREQAKELLQTEQPLAIINEKIIPALNQIGEEFEQKKAFLPQLLMSAEAASAAFEVIKEAMPKNETDQSRAVVLATVQGDIHDIGKNIVKVLLESFGFYVIDLGRDVAPERVLEAVQKSGCRLVGLSALMTTTVPSMEETIRLLKEQVPDVIVMVGGAVLTQEYADMIGADFYGSDAMTSVRYAEEFYQKA
ncbi:MAG: homocysteine methyltransferase [Ruminococcaceae bacterium]|nr:homocysteine methyltransferase [Oscillospiraceae bacterium]